MQSARLDKKRAQHDLHYWKWISLAIQSPNFAPAIWLKHRKECIIYLKVKEFQNVKQTDGDWFTSLGILLCTKVMILLFMCIDQGWLSWESYALTTRFLGLAEDGEIIVKIQN